MSVHYSRYNLNTYYNTPYFQAYLPKDYPLAEVLRECRAFRRLPPNLQELSRKSKDWLTAQSGISPTLDGYDDEGYELDLRTGERLTDEQIDAQWDNKPAKAKVEDIPIPKGGFADPATWQPKVEPDEPREYEGPSREQIRRDIKSHGAAYTAKYYGVPAGGSAEELAEAIFAELGTPDAQNPPPSSS